MLLRSGVVKVRNGSEHGRWARSPGQPRLSDAKPWLVVEERGVRAREGDTGLLVPALVFASVLVWDTADTGAGESTTWIGWIPGSPGRLVSGLG